MNKPDGGAVAVVSATRKVYASENAALNQGTYKCMFHRDAYGRVVACARPRRSSLQGGRRNGMHERPEILLHG